jgi:hypothetical protein
MAYTTINKSTDNFNTKTYSGNGGTQSLTGVGFQPDFTWIKQRTGTTWHNLYDAVRGVTKAIACNDTDAEDTRATGLTAFDSDGFSLGSDSNANAGSGSTYVSWNWKAGGGQGSSNTAGSINTTYTSANTTAGFSISQYTGTGSNATVGHGLGVAPKFIIVKCVSHASEWIVYYGDATDYLKFNEANATADDSTRWNDTAPTNSVFSLGTQGDINTSGRTYIAYCFAEKTGFSKIGSYVGNGNADGTFVYTGFKPAWIMAKKSNSTGNWVIVDTKRDGYNGANDTLQANVTDVESGGNRFDIYSNGFKARSTSSYSNSSGDTFIYMAFGQTLVGTNNIPATAR